MENKQFLPLGKMMSIPVALTKDSPLGLPHSTPRATCIVTLVVYTCGLPLCEMSVKKYLGRNSFMKGLGMLVISLTLQTEVSLLHGF